jgi:hypothetical protein
MPNDTSFFCASFREEVAFLAYRAADSLNFSASFLVSTDADTPLAARSLVFLVGMPVSMGLRINLIQAYNTIPALKAFLRLLGIHHVANWRLWSIESSIAALDPDRQTDAFIPPDFSLSYG